MATRRLYLPLPSMGDVRRYLQPWVVRLWLGRSQSRVRRTRVAGLDLEVGPSVFHPRCFGSSSILGDFIETLDLAGKDVLDMGTGSGVLGLRAARQGARVCAVDVNPAAAQCAARNAESNGLEMSVGCGDLFAGLEGRKFDFVVWNLPFFAADPRNHAEKAFRGGEDFECLKRFSLGLPRHLNPGGSFYGIVSCDADTEALFGLFKDAGFHVQSIESRRWGLGETMTVFRCGSNGPAGPTV